MARMPVLVVALALAACTTMDLDDRWAKTGTPRAQQTWDDWQCRRVAYEEAPRTVDLYVGGVADAVRVYLDDQHEDRTYADCMKARGYTKTAG